MYVSKLDVQGVRNIQKSVLFPKPGMNLIFGDNGSGKTSLLEAIYMLGRGRSFRTSSLKAAINRNSGACTVFALLRKDCSADSPSIPMGVSRSSGGGFQFKVAGRQIHTASQLAKTLPIVLINSDCAALVEGGPANRRRFLDWGMFHVEQGFLDVWRKYQRCHKQRNNLLRHDKIAAGQLALWDKEFVGLSAQVAAYRQVYFDKVLPELQETLRFLDSGLDIEFSVYQGWSKDASLDSELKRNYARDRAAGNTSRGAHRADLKLRSEGRPAAEVLSRGQIKIVVLAMQIAQGRVLERSRKQSCLYLLDDLAAELDKAHFKKGMQLLLRQKAQVFLTGTSKSALEAVMPDNILNDIALFHVKQGEVQSVAEPAGSA